MKTLKLENQLYPQQSLTAVYYPNYGARLDEVMLHEGLNAKDLLLDIVQIAVDTGAIAVSGGMGGDTLIDVMLAIEVGAEIIKDIENIISEAKELSSILTAAIQLDLSGNTEAFYEQVKGLLTRTVSSGLVGKNVKEFIEMAAEALEKIISKLVRAIGKWVSALLPDDFGLGGPAFEASVGSAISSAVDNAYNAAEGALGALGETAELITSGPALEKWATDLINSMIGPLEELQQVLENPDPEKQGWFKSAVAGIQKKGEGILDSTLPTFQEWGRQLGLDIDTSWEDYLDMMRSMPDNNPLKVMMLKGMPYLLDWLKGMRDETVPKAVAIMHKLISWLFAALALLQMISNDDERAEILDIETREYDYQGMSDVQDIAGGYGPKHATKKFASRVEDKKKALAAHHHLNDELLLREWVRLRLT